MNLTDILDLLGLININLPTIGMLAINLPSMKPLIVTLYLYLFSIMRLKSLQHSHDGSGGTAGIAGFVLI